MDALSEAMRAVRVTGALFFNGEFAAPWRFATPAQDQIGAKVSPDSERLVLFHLVTDGHATARTAGHDEVSLAAGDIVVFPHGDAHEMWNGRTSKLFPGARLLPKLAKGELAAEKWGGNGPVTRIICGYLGCERHAESLFLSGLPAILKTNVRSSPAGAWIESAIRHCVSELESQRPVGWRFLPSSPRLCSWKRCAGTWMSCRLSALAGWPARATPRSGRHLHSCIAIPRAHGRCPIWHEQAARRARCWPTDSLGSWASRPSHTWRAGVFSSVRAAC